MITRVSVVPGAFTLFLWFAAGSVAIGCESMGSSSNHSSASTASSAAQAARPAAASSSTSVKLGAPLGASPMVPLASIAKETTKYAKTTVKTEGRVTSVCQAAGCWMEIVDGNGEAHIRMSGHSFFIPKTASGRRAIVEGTVLAKPDNGECEQVAAEATGKMVKVELDATGVELL